MPCGTETLQADGQVTGGALGSGRKTFPSHQEWSWLVRPQLSVRVLLKQETARRQRNTTLCMSNSYWRSQTHKQDVVFFLFTRCWQSSNVVICLWTNFIWIQEYFQDFFIPWEPSTSLKPASRVFTGLNLLCLCLARKLSFSTLFVFTSNETLCSSFSLSCHTESWQVPECDLWKMQPFHWLEKRSTWQQGDIVARFTDVCYVFTLVVEYRRTVKNNTAFLLGANRFNKASPPSTDCYSSTVTSEGAHHVSVDFIAISVVFVWTHCLKVQVCGACHSSSLLLRSPYRVFDWFYDCSRNFEDQKHVFGMSATSAAVMSCTGGVCNEVLNTDINHRV